MDYPNGAHFQGPVAPAPHQNPHHFSQQSSPSPHPPHAPHPDPSARFAHHPTQHHYNNGATQNYPIQHPMPNGGAMMRQAPQLQTRGPQNYIPPSGPYSQSNPTPPVTAPQKLAHINKASSPPNQTSPYSTPPGSQAPPSEPSRTPPMAAPSSTQPLAQQGQTGAQGQPRSVPQSPLSPEAQARERERMALLLEINTELLQEVINLQSQGKGGSAGAPEGAAKEGQQPSKEYFELLRRLQANLSYLASSAERYTSKPTTAVPPGPAIMGAPAAPASLQELYARLQALFPGWKGQNMVKNSPQQRPNIGPLPGGAGTPTSQGSFGTPSQQPMISAADYKS